MAHAIASGSDDRSMAPSRARADAVHEGLAAHGLADAQIHIHVTDDFADHRVDLLVDGDRVAHHDLVTSMTDGSDVEAVCTGDGMLACSDETCAASGTEHGAGPDLTG